MLGEALSGAFWPRETSLTLCAASRLLLHVATDVDNNKGLARDRAPTAATFAGQRKGTGFCRPGPSASKAAGTRAWGPRRPPRLFRAAPAGVDLPGFRARAG